MARELFVNYIHSLQDKTIVAITAIELDLLKNIAAIFNESDQEALRKKMKSATFDHIQECCQFMIYITYRGNPTFMAMQLIDARYRESKGIQELLEGILGVKLTKENSEILHLVCDSIRNKPNIELAKLIKTGSLQDDYIAELN
ncbi:MAG TPA: hypothetical protein PK809_15025 [Bacteroidia bacterium]|nr:hypothetical protein [Bacteroidia bacterium]